MMFDLFCYSNGLTKLSYKILIHSVLVILLFIYLFYPTSTFSQWESLGPNGGSVRTIEIDTSTGSIYVASYPGGIFKKGTEAFQPLYNGITFDKGFPSSSVVSLNPQIPGTLLTTVLNTIYLSTNYGEFWSPTNVIANSAIRNAFFMSDTIALAISGEELFRSIDGGNNWDIILSGLSLARKMVVDRIQNTVYIAGFDWLLKSTDGGNYWETIPCPSNGVKYLHVGQISGSLFLLTNSVFFSSNGGVSWQNIGSPSDPWSIYQDAFNPSIIYLGTIDGIYRKDGLDSSWTNYSSGLEELQGGNWITPLVITLTGHPTIPGYIYAGTENAGLYFTTNSGVSWSRIGVPAETLYDVEVMDSSSEKLIVAGARGMQTYTNRKWNNSNLFYDIGATRNVISVDPVNHSTILSGGYTLNNAIINVSSDSGFSWTSIFTVSGGGYITSFARHPYQPEILYAGLINGSEITGLVRTTNGGINDSSWQVVPTAELWSIGAVGISPHDTSIYAVEIFNSLVHRSTDQGQSFHDVGSVPIGRGDYITDLVFDKVNNNIYITTRGIYRSTDNGMTWESIGLVEFLVTSMFIDPVYPNHWYAATLGNGIFYSSDGGQTWSAVEPAIPSPFVYSITSISSLTKRTIFAAASGGSLYKLDIDLTPSSVFNNDKLKSQFELEQNYPNPFSGRSPSDNPSTTIRFKVSHEGFVALKLYNILGEEVATLVNKEKSPGTYEVRFTVDDLRLSSGVYFYQIITVDLSGKQSFSDIKKMIVVK